eukprot:2203079-Alexandrium_andersonii.AAC.1
MTKLQHAEPTCSMLGAIKVVNNIARGKRFRVPPFTHPSPRGKLSVNGAATMPKPVVAWLPSHKLAYGRRAPCEPTND